MSISKIFFQLQIDIMICCFESIFLKNCCRFCLLISECIFTLWQNSIFFVETSLGVWIIEIIPIFWEILYTFWSYRELIAILIVVRLHCEYFRFRMFLWQSYRFLLSQSVSSLVFHHWCNIRYILVLRCLYRLLRNQKKNSRRGLPLYMRICLRHGGRSPLLDNASQEMLYSNFRYLQDLSRFSRPVRSGHWWELRQ